MITLHRNARVGYDVAGSGPVVVLLHGFLEDRGIWKGLASEWATHHRVLTIDLPGWGGSEASGYVLTMDDMAHAVSAVLAAEGVDRCALLGHSMGGYVALAFAELYPEKLNALGLLHSSALPDSDTKKADRLRAIDAVRTDLALYCRVAIPNLFAPEARQRLSADIASLVQRASATAPMGVAASLHGMMQRPDRTHVLARASFPILFLQGELDPVVTGEARQAQQAAAPRMRCITLPNVAHMGYLEAPVIFQEQVRGFLDQIRSVIRCLRYS